jgi:hypothetical protein
MIIRRLSTAYALLTFLKQDDAVARQLRLLLHEPGRFPTRRTWERRLAALPQHLPSLIGGFGGISSLCSRHGAPTDAQPRWIVRP